MPERTPEEDLRYEARLRGLCAGAVHRKDAWAIGTLVRWRGKNSKVTYRITGIRPQGMSPTATVYDVQCTPLHPGPGRSTFWTNIEYLRQVQE